MTLAWVLRLSTLVMPYESKCLPSVINLDYACKEVGSKKICILWQSQYILP